MRHKDMNRTYRDTKVLAKQVLAVCMSISLVAGMTGCGKDKAEKVPELLEPVSTNEAYRPVTLGDIGVKVIKSGTVVPTDYCYYYESATTLSKIYVNVGDEVKSGTVIAEAADKTDSEDDTDASADDDGGDSEETSDSFTQDIKQKIYEQNQTELDWKIKACEEIGDTKGAAAHQVEKAVNAENNRYENLLYEYEQKKQKEESADKDKKKESGTLKADHAGYVTYIKKLGGEDNSVAGSENVAVVSDYSDPYIEMTGETYKKNGYSMYNNMYTVIDGKRYDIEVYGYTNQEIAVAQSMSSLPYMRFKLKGVKNPESILKVGNNLSLYFSTSDAKNVLTVGNDSLYEENGQTFVYVKTDTSAKEKREVKTGLSDSNYTEIVSGLKEGELVYYASDAVMPSDYTEYKVALNSYSKTSTSKEFSVEDLSSVSYTAPCEGRFTEFNVKKGQKVKKGDVLFVIDSGGGTAAVKDIDNQIQDENQNYNSGMKEYDDQINDLTKEIEHYRKGKVATPTDANNTLYMAEQLECQRNVVSYNKQLLTHSHDATIKSLTASKEKLNKNNDGSGKISVYAEQSGKVLSVDAGTDAAVKEGQTVLSIGNSEKQIIALSVSEGKMGVNQTVTFVNKSSKSQKYSGICIGSTGDSGKAYISTDSDGKVHVTKCAGSDELKYYIKLDDEKLYKSPKSYQASYPTVTFDNVVMIPTNMIYHEASKNNSNTYDYVWLILDGQIVKQYVTLGEESQNHQTIILSGLSEGDVIAKESVSSSTKTSDSTDDGEDSGADDGPSDGADNADNAAGSDSADAAVEE